MTIPGWAFLVTGLAMGMVGFVVTQQSSHTDKRPMTDNSDTVFDTENTTLPVFDFYTSLPQRDTATLEERSTTGDERKKEKTPPREKLSVASSPSSDASDPPSSKARHSDAVAADGQPAGRFLLQVASFQLKEDAQKFRRRLSSSGFRAYVETVEIQGSGRWYRVRVGPYESKESALTDRQRLPEYGRDSFVISAR
ncbi:MAG: SPOR domain-containing protein [Kistimonas sp.]|nr:SPOR domain-containing protein [Kistimonas sp.]